MSLNCPNVLNCPRPCPWAYLNAGQGSQAWSEVCLNSGLTGFSGWTPILHTAVVLSHQPDLRGGLVSWMDPGSVLQPGLRLLGEPWTCVVSAFFLAPCPPIPDGTLVCRPWDRRACYFVVSRCGDRPCYRGLAWALWDSALPARAPPAGGHPRFTPSLPAALFLLISGTWDENVVNFSSF